MCPCYFVGEGKGGGTCNAEVDDLVVAERDREGPNQALDLKGETGEGGEFE